MKYLLKILLAILVSGPIALCILYISDYLIIHSSFFKDDYYSFNMVMAIIYMAYFYFFYLICGLPTTLATDLILRLFPSVERKFILLSFTTYTGAGILLILLGYDSPSPIVSWLVFVPVYTYLLTLILIRAKYKKGELRLNKV